MLGDLRCSSGVSLQRDQILGFFDLFKSNKDGGARKSNAADKFSERANDKRAQTYDRVEALSALSELGTKEAVAALLKRFTFQVDPSISDQEEKDIAFRGVLRAGDEALEPIRNFVKKAESVAWPLRVIKELLGPEEYVGEVLAWLEPWDTDYRKFSDPKLQLLAALEEQQDPRIVAAVAPYLDDTLETARFHAVATLFAQDDEAARAPLVARLVDEESVRIRGKIAEGLALKGWFLRDDEQEPVRKVLPGGYVVDGSGRIRR